MGVWVIFIFESERKWKSLSHVRLFATSWTVHGILQVRILEWVVFPFPRMVNKGLCFTKLPVVLIPSRLFCILRTHLLSPWHKMTHCWSLLREERLPGRRAGMRPPTWKGLEKEMATPSSILACRIPWMEEPGGLMFMGSQRVGHDWVTNTFTLSYRIRFRGNVGWQVKNGVKKQQRENVRILCPTLDFGFFSAALLRCKLNSSKFLEWTPCKDRSLWSYRSPQNSVG